VHACLHKLTDAAFRVHLQDKTFKAYIELELQLGNVDRWGCSCNLCLIEEALFMLTWHAARNPLARKHTCRTASTHGDKLACTMTAIMTRCRILYEKYLEWSPANCHAWIKFAELEKTLGEAARTRAIYELAISQPVLDMPEALWKVGFTWNARAPCPRVLRCSSTGPCVLALVGIVHLVVWSQCL
jgi:hypothetical protein